MTWHVELSDAAERHLRRLPRDIQARIGRAIDELEADPFRGDVILLKGRQWQGRYRKRVGQYHILFMPSHAERIVEISAILAPIFCVVEGRGEENHKGDGVDGSLLVCCSLPSSRSAIIAPEYLRHLTRENRLCA